MFEIKLYNPSLENEWNRFVANGKNATFLFDRRYMDYHHDRFTDSSLMFYRKGTLFALLPANRVDDVLYSHQGLTYGGLLMNKKASAENIVELYKELNDWLSAQGIVKVVYKAMPWIYHRLPAQEDLYALTEVCHAELTTREISSTIILNNRIKFAESRKSGLRKALRSNLRFAKSDDLESFWNMLNNNLMTRHGVHPVHSLAELQLLKSRFPDKITLYLIYNIKGRSIAGTLIFDTGQVIHTQYIASTDEGKAEGALDLLFDKLINNNVYPSALYFDFGKSTENGGHYLNNNLIFQKEGFGGRGVCYDTYTWKV